MNETLMHDSSVVIGVLGLGKAGCAFVRSFHGAGLKVVAASRQEAWREAMSGFLLRPAFEKKEDLVSFLAAQEESMLLLAVSDDVLGEVATQLAALPEVPKKIMHCCGAKSFDTLFALQNRAQLAVLHPMAALQREKGISPGTLVAVEASSDAFADECLALAARLGALGTRRKKGEHVAYHLAAVVAGNLAFALLQHGIELLSQAGIEEEIARMGLAQLLASTASAALQKPLSEALTGPVVRQDVQTLGAHLTELACQPELLAVYRSLSLKLCDVALQDAFEVQALLLEKGGA